MTLAEQLDKAKHELDSVLKFRDGSVAQLKVQCHDLEQKLKKTTDGRDALVSELKNQKILVGVLEAELSSIKTEHETVQQTVTEQESRMKACFDRVQSSLVNTEALLKKLKAQKVCHSCVESEFWFGLCIGAHCRIE